MFLDKLKRELLNEDQRISQLPEKFSNFLLYIRASEPVTYELLKNYTDYYWMEPTQDHPEPTMGVAMYQGRLQFYIGKGFYSQLTISQLAFLLYHELAHYKRGHCNRNFNLGKSNHNLNNIVEDIYINEDANRDGEFAGIPIKFVDGGLMKESKEYRGAQMNGIDKVMEKTLSIPRDKINPKEYLPIGNSADLYKYLINKAKQDGDPNQDQEGQQGQEGQEGQQGQEGQSGNQQSEIIKPKKGDIIRGPDGQYGRVVKTVGGNVKQIEPLTKQEAEDIVLGKKSFLAKKAEINDFTIKNTIDIA